MGTQRVTLRKADLDGGVCPVPEECAAALKSHGTVTVALSHRVHGVTPGRHEFTGGIQQDVEWQLTGVEWPTDVHTGVIVTVSWQVTKGKVLLRTVPLDGPVRLDGVGYWHEYDPKAVTRDHHPQKSNRGQVMHAVRRLGRVFDDGSAVFPEADLAARAGLGKGTKGTFLLRNAVDQLIREGFVTRVPGSVDAAGVPSYPAAADEQGADLLFYAPLIEPAGIPSDDPESESDRREHWVSGFIRKLPPGAQPSPRQLSLHRHAVDTEQIPDDPLEPGYTFVKKHHRNG